MCCKDMYSNPKKKDKTTECNPAAATHQHHRESRHHTDLRTYQSRQHGVAPNRTEQTKKAHEHVPGHMSGHCIHRNPRTSENQHPDLYTSNTKRRSKLTQQCATREQAPQQKSHHEPMRSVNKAKELHHSPRQQSYHTEAEQASWAEASSADQLRSDHNEKEPPGAPGQHTTRSASDRSQPPEVMEQSNKQSKTIATHVSTANGLTLNQTHGKGGRSAARAAPRKSSHPRLNAKQPKTHRET